MLFLTMTTFLVAATVFADMFVIGSVLVGGWLLFLAAAVGIPAYLIITALGI